MKLIDYFLLENVFDEINKIETLPFLSHGKAVQVNKLFLFKHGGKKLCSKVELLTVAELAEMLHNLYSERWKDLILIDNTDFDITSGTTHLENENNGGNSTNTNTNSVINKVAAFDDVDLIDDTGTITDNTGTNTTTGSKSKEKKTLSLHSAFINLSLKQKNNIIDLVFDDVKNFIALSIY